ncbi:hypothetical protein OG323_22650 [Streptomyces cyaneofuscatus]|uniref:hypothetical protein n=1 Tax=Streptomyces cyaneofuscatus TaxID=66883 RepID=UPI003866ACC1|nr:hypothetical protein OG323_22650 [Streptomyces cyaneofuscatus]
MTTALPLDAVRQALDDTEAALARLRPALGAAYGIAGENLTKAAGQLDVAERAQAAAERRAQRAEADMKEIAEAYELHRRSLAAIFAMRADAPFEEITEYAARTLNRIGVRLAAAEEVRAEAVRVADRATQTLLRVKHARTAADAWTELGTHYHLSATEAGRRARDWRSAAERDATERAEAAAVVGTRYMGDAERFHAAWQSARSRARAHLGEQQRIRGWLTHWADRARAAETDAERFHAAWHSARDRAQRTASELRVTQASRRRWKRRAKTAEQRLAAVRQYLAAAYPNDIAWGIRDDLALILDGRPAKYAPMEGQ